METKIGDKIAGSGEVEYNLHPQSLNEAIEWWDGEKSLFSVSMGGLGPGYEQALQIAGMELIRGFKDKDIDWDNIENLGDEMNNYMWGNDEIKKLRLSGAQAGAAKNMACVFIKNGWEKGLEMATDDRHIQISKNFPG